MRAVISKIVVRVEVEHIELVLHWQGGDHTAEDMAAVRISPDLRMTIVSLPAYFAMQLEPKAPQDLANHQCINVRLPTAGGLYAPELERGRRELRVRVEGQLAFNKVPMILRADNDGSGLAYVLEDQTAANVADGRLIRVLEDWRRQFSGYHLYSPSRRQPPAAFALLVDALRYRGGGPSSIPDIASCRSSRLFDRRAQAYLPGNPASWRCQA